MSLRGLRLNRIGIAAVILLAQAIACLALPSAAQIDSDRARAALGAGEQLLEAIRSADGNLSVPRLSEPGSLPLFDGAFDPALWGSAPPDPADLLLLNRLQEKAGAIISAYLLQNTSLDDDLSQVPTRQAAGRNFVRFLPELALAYDFRVLTGAMIAEGSVAAVRSAQVTDQAEIDNALAAIITDQAEMLRAIIACSSDGRIDPAWRRDRVRVMRRTATRFATLFDKKSAQILADRALAAAISEADPQVAEEFKAFALALLR